MKSQAFPNMECGGGGGALETALLAMLFLVVILVTKTHSFYPGKKQHTSVAAAVSSVTGY